MLFTFDWQPLHIVNRFLMENRYKPRKTRRWQNTQRAGAQDLAQWFDYLAANDIDWREATSSDLDDFASSMAESISPTTGEQYCTSTVRRRVSSVRQFYRWVLRDRSVSVRFELPSDERSSATPVAREAGMSRHLGIATARAYGASNAKGRDPDDRCRPLSMKSLSRILEELGPPVFGSGGKLLDWEAGTPLRRDRLMAEAAYHTGMRSVELASVSAVEVLAREREVQRSSPWEQVILTVDTKGRSNRKVLVPAFLLRGLVRYHDTERAAAVLKAQTVIRGAGERYREPRTLFLNGTDANDRDVGQQIHSETASRAFTRAVLAQGLFIKRLGYKLDPATGGPLYDEDDKAIEVEITKPAFRFHDLRHTFAVMFYQSEVRRGNLEPWEKLRVLLGHASSDTTRDIYLRHVDVDEAQLSDAVARHLRARLHDMH